MQKSTHILIVEDIAADAELAQRAIRKVLKDCDFQVVETRKDFLKALETFQPDVILSDYALPSFDGMTALKLALKHAPLTPLIIWTGSSGEDVAVECMKAGANNYVLKENLKRLGPAILRALEEKALLIASKQAEEALQASEKRFRALIENGLDNISLLSADGTLLWESPSSIRTLHYAPNEHLGLNIFDALMHPDDLQWTRDLFAKLVQEPGSRNHILFRLRHADGTWHWVEAIVTNLLHEPGIQAIVANYRDVNDQKRAEEELSRSQTQYKHLVETSHDLIWSVDAEGKFTFLNRAAKEIYGYEPEELMGHSFFEVMDPGHYHRDAIKFKETISAVDELREVETYVLHRDGRPSILSANSVVIRENGNVIGVTGSSRDITLRKQEEARLNDLLAFNEKILNHSSVGILTFKVTGQCVFANEKAALIVGATVTQLLAQNYRAIPAWRKSGLYDLAEKAITTQAPITADIHHVSTFGKDVWMTVHCVTFKAKGEDHLLLSISDITERKQTEEALRHSEWQYRTLAENSLQGIAIYQRQKIVYANTAMSQINGYTREELINMSAEQVMALTHPADRAIIAERSLKRVAGETLSPEVEGRILRKDGTTAWVQSFNNPIEYDGKPAILSTMIDITERKRAEEALRESENRLILALSGAQMSVWEWDLQNNHILWSPEFFELTGINEDGFGRTFEAFTDLVHAEDVERLMVAAEKAVTDKTLFAEEFRITRPDGETRWLSNLGHAEYDATRDHLRLIGTVQDITQRKQAEIERQALLEIMQGLTNTRDLHELLGLIHHSIANVIYARNFFVVLYEESTGLFEEIYSVDQYDRPEPPSKLEKSITSYVFRSGEPLLLTQALFDELESRGEVELVGTDSDSWLGVPLKTSGRTIGVMAVQDYENASRYSERDRDFLASIAAQIALTIEHREAGIALRESEEHHRAIFEGVQDAIFVESADGKILMVNEPACEMFGYSRAEFLTKTVADLVPEGHTILTAEGLDSSLSTEPRESANRRANGEIFPIEISGRLQVINGEKVLLVVVRDITERKKAAELLQESEERFSSAFEYASIGMALVSPEGHWLRVNWALCELLGYTKEELSQKTFQEITYPDDLEKDLGYVRQVLAGAIDSFQMEKRYLHKSGHVIWVLLSVSLVQDHEGRPLYFISQIQDIRERKQAEAKLLTSEARYRLATQATKDVIWEWTLEDNKLIWTENAQLVFGYSAEEIGPSAIWWDEHIHPQDRERVVSKLAAWTATGEGKSDWSDEYRLLLKDGSYAYVDDHAYLERDPAGRTIRMIGAMSNITERKRAEAAEREQRALAEALRDTAETLNSTLDYGEVLDHILAAVGRVVPHDAATIMLIDGEVARVVRSQGYEERGFKSEVMQVELPLSEATNLRQMLEAGQPVVVSDTGSYPGWKRLTTTDWLCSNVGAPISINGDVIGFILLDSATCGFFTAVHAERLEAFANQAALAIQNARLLQQAQEEITERKRAEEEMRRETEMRVALLETTRDLIIEGDLSSLLQTIVERAARLLHAGAGGLYLCEPERGQVKCVVSYNTPHDFTGVTLKYGEGAAGLVAQTGEPLIIDNYSTWEGRARVYDNKEYFQALLTAAIKWQDQVIGVIHVLDYHDERHFTENDLNILISFANQAAIAIHNAGLLQQAQEEIAERKRAEEAVRHSENKARALLNAIPDLMFRLDREGCMLDYKADQSELYAQSEPDLIGKKLRDISPPEFSALIERYIQKTLESGEMQVFEYQLPIAERGLQDYEARMVTSGNDEVTAIVRNITERKQAEESLRAERRKAEKYLEIAGVMMLVLDREGSVTLINQKGCEILGYSADEVMGKNWIDTFLPEATREELQEVFHQLISDNIDSSSYYENSILTKGGEERLIAWHNTLLRDEQGTIISSISSGEDITERKRAAEELRISEERFRQLADNIQEVFWMTDAETGEEIYASPAAETIWRQPLEQLMHEPAAFINSVFPEDQAQVLYNLEKEKHGEKVEMEYRIVRPDGSLRWLWDRAFPIFESSGKVKRIAGITADITERKEAAERLRESEDRYHSLFQNQLHGAALHEIITNDQGQPVDYRFLKVNPSFEKMTGLNAEAIVGRRVTEVLPGIENDQFIQIYGQVALTGEPIHISEYATPLGKYYEINAYSTGPRQFAVSFMDVTERKESEMALVKSQSRYRELFDSSPISIWEEDFSLVKKRIDSLLESGVTDLRQFLFDHPEVIRELASLVKIIDVNQASLELYGVDRKEDLLISLSDLLDRDSTQHFEEEILGLVSPLKRFSWEGTDVTRHGRRIDVLINGSIPHGYEEDWSKLIVSIIDISDRKRAEEEIRRGAEETAALLETSLALTNLDLQATLHTISQSAKNLFAADGCRIFLMEPNGEELRCVLALQENVEAFLNLKVRIGEGVTGTVAASGRGEIVNEMQNDPRSIQVAGTLEEDEAIMFAPLKERDQTIGVLSIRRVGATRPFQPADLELLEALASMAASAVSNARLFEEAQRRLTELGALYENGLAVGRLLKPNEIGERVISTIARYLQWHHVTIRLRREESDDLELVAFSLPNLKEEERAHTEQHFVALVNKVGQGLSGWVIQTGEPFRTGNVHAHAQYANTLAGIQSGLYMPLKVGERAIGVISVESEAPDAFTDKDERLLATLGNQVATAFENARLYQAIERELSERKRTEAALRSSEVHYRELADSITDILFELDEDLCYTHWNKASEMFSGISAEDAIGESMMEVFGTSEEQARRAEFYRSVFQEQQAKIFETEVVAKGQKRALEINAYPSARGVSVVAKDVTDRKRSETIMQKRFELMEYSAHYSLNELMQRTVDEVSELTESTIGFFHFVGEDQNTLGMQTWSTNALRLFNVPVSEGTHRELDRAGVWAEAVRQRRPLIQNDYESLEEKKGLPKGHVPLVREIVIPILRNEKVMAVMGIGNKPQDYTLQDLEIAERLADYAWDITERKQMQQALENERNQLAQHVEERTADLSRANSNLARALRVKDEFLANMSHELRTPLNAILGLSESLGEQIAGPLNEKQQKYITTISESGHHLLSLINDILDLAKIEAGQITLDINKMDIHSVCQASLRMIKQLAQKKNQEVLLEIEDNLGWMWADERRLKQMIVNLLSNAVKFTPENGKIGLQVHGDQDANKITITVWDNGIGIKEADLTRLFQPFIQLDSGLAREATGTGLGLALVAQMARLHGGSVSAVSDPGKGSRFSIVLPWEPALAIDTASRLRTTSKFRAIKPDETNKPTILLVEDTKEVVMMVRDYLELAGYTVVTAQDGMDALVQARHTRPDLILMDVQMPRMDGLEATRKLRNEPAFKYTPIIALTALAMPSDRERCLAAGMDEYVSKPINLKALIRIIQGCLFDRAESKPG